MDLDNVTSYVSSSPFVREYALEGGLDSSLPASDVVITAERVVLVDALLRKHYVELTVDDLEELTGLSEHRFRDGLDALVNSGLVAYENGEYWIDKSDSRVSDLRDEQTSLLGE